MLASGLLLSMLKTWKRAGVGDGLGSVRVGSARFVEVEGRSIEDDADLQAQRVVRQDLNQDQDQDCMSEEVKRFSRG